jgi:hypothetical protein
LQGKGFDDCHPGPLAYLKTNKIGTRKTGTPLSFVAAVGPREVAVTVLREVTLS